MGLAAWVVLWLEGGGASDILFSWRELCGGMQTLLLSQGGQIYGASTAQADGHTKMTPSGLSDLEVCVCVCAGERSV